MKNLISWEFPEFKPKERKKGWYIWATIILILLIFYSIASANFLFGLIIIMAVIIMFVNSHKENSEIKFKITPKGIELDNKKYSFKELKDFWIIYEPPIIKNLYINFKSSIKPTLIIPLEKENPVKVRKILKEYLEEDLEKESESTTEILERILKL